MGKDTVRFSCHHCNHCCTDVVCLPTAWDVRRIIRATGKDPNNFLEFLTPEEVEGVTKNDGAWLEIDGERYMMALKRTEKGCHFLNKKTKYCSIYESRPMLCRLYPFLLQQTRDGAYKSFTLHKNVGCPKHTDGEYETKPLYELFMEDDDHQDTYHVLVDLYNEREDEDKDVWDFVEVFTRGL